MDKIGVIKLDGKEYVVEIRNNQQYINNMKPEEFVDWLADNGEWSSISDLIRIGMNVVQNDETDCQKMANELYQQRSN